MRLTQQEQEKVDRLEELKRHRREGTRLVTDDQLAEAETNASFARANAEARERAQQETRQAEEAKATAFNAEQAARARDSEDAYKRECRRWVPASVSDQEFERDVWPQLRQQWIVRQALSEDDAAQQAHRQLYQRF